MDFEHTDCDEAEAVDFRETRGRFLLARARAIQCWTEHYRAVRKVRDDAHGKAARTVSDGLTP